MDSRPGRASVALILAVSLSGMVLAWPAGAHAVTVTVGREALSTEPTTNFGCTAAADGPACTETVSPTALTGGARAVVPGDGVITSWRVVGSESGFFHDLNLWVLRPSGAQYKFVHTSDVPASALDGTAMALSPPVPVAAGDYLGVQAFAQGIGGDASAAVEAVGVVGGSYNVFVGSNAFAGKILSPTSTGTNVEPLFNADVVLDPPVVSGLSPASGSIAGGETVTVTGDHLTGASHVQFGGVPASAFSVVSNTEVTAVAPASAPGTVDVTVETVGGTSAASAADRYTFIAPAAGAGAGGLPPAAASFAGSRSSIRVNRRRSFKFGFTAGPGLTGAAVFKSLNKITVSRKQKITLARKSFTVPADGKVRLLVTLSKRNFRILRLNRNVRSTVTVTLRNAAGLTSTASKNITLRAP